jgi:hypothetical protein
MFLIMSQRKYNCFQSTIIEAFIFEDCNELPDENCPICQDKLSQDSSYGCACSPYARRLICGHYAHVSCQIDYNPNVNKCSICRVDLFKLRDEKIKKQQKKIKEQKEKE